MGKTKIDAATWNPVTGCTQISPGCAHCYARRMAHRLAGRCGYPAAPHEFDVTLHPACLDGPLRWKKPRRVFVCSMSDLFHEDVPFEFIWRVYYVMRQKSRHTFQVLTKRPQRAVEFYYWLSNQHFESVDASWFPNIWVGVTAENQEQADIRIPLLLQIPAAVRFVSVEPMLSKVDIYTKLIPIQRLGGVDWVKLDWVICGGETGPGARPLHPDWVRSLRDQCVAARVPFYFKQWGEWVDGQNVPEAHLDAALDCAGDAQRDYRYMGARGETQMFRIERRRAGHLLDGVEWRQFPEVV